MCTEIQIYNYVVILEQQIRLWFITQDTEKLIYALQVILDSLKGCV